MNISPNHEAAMPAAAVIEQQAVLAQATNPLELYADFIPHPEAVLVSVMDRPNGSQLGIYEVNGEEWLASIPAHVTNKAREATAESQPQTYFESLSGTSTRGWGEGIVGDRPTAKERFRDRLERAEVKAATPTDPALKFFDALLPEHSGSDFTAADAALELGTSPSPSISSQDLRQKLRWTGLFNEGTDLRRPVREVLEDSAHATGNLASAAGNALKETFAGSQALRVWPLALSSILLTQAAVPEAPAAQLSTPATSEVSTPETPVAPITVPEVTPKELTFTTAHARSLDDIAEDFGVTQADLLADNPTIRVAGGKVQPGTPIHVRAAASTVKVENPTELSTFAKQVDVSEEAIISMNPALAQQVKVDKKADKPTMVQDKVVVPGRMEVEAQIPDDIDTKMVLSALAALVDTDAKTLAELNPDLSDGTLLLPLGADGLTAEQQAGVKKLLTLVQSAGQGEGDVVPKDLAPIPSPEHPVEVPTRIQEIKDKISSSALGYEGITEDPNTPNHSELIDKLFQMGLTGKNAEWCASFVSRVLLDAGIPLMGGSKDGHKGPDWQIEFVNNITKAVRDSGGMVADRDTFMDPDFVPEVGDIVIYNKDGKLYDARSGANHVAIVIAYNAETGEITTMAGNEQNRVNRSNHVLRAPLVSVRGRGSNIAGILRVPELIAPIENPVAPEVPKELPSFDEAQKAYNTALEILLDEVASGEATVDVWNAFNRGGSGDANGDYTLNDGRKITDLTLHELVALQALPKGHPDRLFAVGRFQIIPGTMLSALQALGIDMNQKFTPELQTKLAVDYLLLHKRPALAKFLNGEAMEDDEVAALEQLCREWASVPCADGESHYAGDGAGNGAKGGVERAKEIMVMLVNVRNAYITLVTVTSKSPTPAPTEPPKTKDSPTSEAPILAVAKEEPLQPGQTWLSTSKAADLYAPMFATYDQLNGWIGSLRTNADGKVLVDIHNSPENLTSAN